jgi:RNA polymerase sigma factor (sigma-70 family)
MNWSSATDPELLRATREHPEAFGAFYRRHVLAITAFLLQRCGDRQFALDLVAETFAAALVHAERYRTDRGPANAWLRGIARHKLADSLRRQRAEDRARRRLGLERLEFSDAELDAVERAVHAEQQGGRLVAELARLPADQREAIEGHVLRDEPYDVIARRTGDSSGTLRQRVRRGLQRISTRVQEESNP